MAILLSTTRVRRLRKVDVLAPVPCPFATMFSASAELYDLIYSGSRDYASEAAQIAGLIRRDHPQAQRVLDVACGTAEHARLLTIQHEFHVDGLDLDAAFVRIAKQKLPNASFYQADMITFDLSERYDVIICLFSSIGYVRTLENVRRTLARFRAHLADGGIVRLEPWFPPDLLDPGRISVKRSNRQKLASVAWVMWRLTAGSPVYDLSTSLGGPRESSA
jgi:SAM-dependent methyltransferase